MFKNGRQVSKIIHMDKYFSYFGHLALQMFRRIAATLPGLEQPEQGEKDSILFFELQSRLFLNYCISF